MNSGLIVTYTKDLRALLAKTLSSQDAEDIAMEAQNHMSERASELERAGMTALEAEQQATQDFGDIKEMSVELAKGYPPKPPLDPSKLRWLPELSVVIFLGFAATTYSIYHGARGVESAAQNLIPSTLMLIVPGMMTGLGRLKYPRIRPISTLSRMATYGLILSLSSTACLVVLQISGKATLTETFPMFYGFCTASVVLYGIMLTTFKNGKAYNFVRRRLRD